MKKPDENEMFILRNIEAGKKFEAGLDTSLAVPAMWRCITNGWVDGGRLTVEGSAVISPVKVTKGNFEIIVLKEDKTKLPIPLPPKGGWGVLPP